MSRNRSLPNRAMQLALEALGFKKKNPDKATVSKKHRRNKSRRKNKTQPISKKKAHSQKKSSSQVKSTLHKQNSPANRGLLKNPKKEVQKTPPLPKKIYSLDKPEEFPLIQFCPNSQFNPVLLKNEGYTGLKINLSKSYRTQKHDGSTGYTDIVIGLDFGTTNTKVILMEQGSRNAWAIPFTDDKENPYLLPSRVYINNDEYGLSGAEERAINDLKLPLLLDEYDENNRCQAVAFLALVMRQSREWFLQNAASAFNGFYFEWHYHMGLPASNYDNEKLVKVFKGSLLSAAIVSLKKSESITKSTIEQTLKTVDKYFTDNILNLDVHPDFVNVFPEISAQLHGYILSDKWDKARPKFMLADIGGGTVDASIVNVQINNKGEPEYNYLKSEVKPLGVSRLNKHRMKWIERSIKYAEEKSLNLVKKLNDINSTYDQTLPVLPEIYDYLLHIEWPDPENFNIDVVFYKLYSVLLWSKLINPVRKKIDTKVDQWLSLQFVLCGGGGQHPLYRRFIEKVNNASAFHVNLDVVLLDKPDKLISPEMNSDNYHRLSVAYGLSYLEPGKLIPESLLKPIPKDLTRLKRVTQDFIDKDVM